MCSSSTYAAIQLVDASLRALVSSLKAEEVLLPIEFSSTIDMVCHCHVSWRRFAGDPESKDDVEADTSGDETDPVDPGHKARDEMFAAVASIRVGY